MYSYESSNYTFFIPLAKNSKMEQISYFDSSYKEKQGLHFLKGGKVYFFDKLVWGWWVGLWGWSTKMPFEIHTQLLVW